MKFIVKWFTTSIAVAVAVLIVPGISVGGNNPWLPIIIAGAALGLISATLGLILRIGSFGCIILTLGLFNLVINAWLLLAAAWTAQTLFGVPFVVDGFWPAFWGGIVISLVSTMLAIYIPYEDKQAYAPNGRA